MVNNGKSNEAIYRYIAEDYGKNQVAVPHNDFMKRLSMGLPYLLMGLIVVVATGFGWFWVSQGSDDDDGTDPIAPEKRDSIDRIVEADENNPLG